MKKWFFWMGILAALNVFADEPQFSNMGYVEVSQNNLGNAGCYIREDNQKPFFDIVSIMSAYILTDHKKPDPNKPYIYLEPHVSYLLNKTNQVAELQKKGIKVLLTFMSNKQKAGWACMTDEGAIQRFANNIVEVINKYHLDGVDIDDEYYTCKPNVTSMLRIAEAIKNNPKFKGKLLTKALYADQAYFEEDHRPKRLVDLLDYGWEMTYENKDYTSRLSPYLRYKMLKKEQLYLGVSTALPISDSPVKHVIDNGLRGMMVYNIKDNSTSFLSTISEIEYNTKVIALPNCLKAGLAEDQQKASTKANP